MNQSDKPKRRPAREFQFAPQHFPNGTVFKLNDKMRNFGSTGSLIYTVVNGLVRNGARSYVAKTGQMREHTGEVSFNLSHVECIVKRGDGPLVIDHGWYGFSGKVSATARKEVDLMEIHESAKRGFYTTASMRSLVHYEVSKFAPVGAFVSIDYMVGGIVGQSWCTEVRLSQHFTVHRVNKKRLRKWLRANFNRYMLNMKAEEKAYDEMMAESYEKDWETDFDRRYPIKDLVPIEGSHYSPDDDEDRQLPHHSVLFPRRDEEQQSV